MRLDLIISEMKSKRDAVAINTFKSPPQDFFAFQKQLGFYLGMSECIRFIEEVKDKDDD